MIQIHKTIPMNTLKQFLQTISELWNNSLPVDSKVKYSVKKYTKTYELLEKYDQKTTPTPKEMADPGRLTPYIQQLQKGTRNHGRAHPTV